MSDEYTDVSGVPVCDGGQGMAGDPADGEGNNGGDEGADDDGGWRDRAADLREQGDIPHRRSQVVAMAEADFAPAEIADELGIETDNIASHLGLYYHRDYRPAVWLAENGPDVGSEYNRM